MRKNKKIIFALAIILVILIIALAYNYVLHGGERNIIDEKSAFEVSAKNINQEFSKNIDSANVKYLDKIISVKGIVTSVKNHELIVDNTVICNLKNIDNSIKVDQNIIIKGRVVGYDDLMGELKLDQCLKN